MIIELGTDEFDPFYTEAPVLLYATANWCGPCRMLRPVLESIADQLQIVRFDVDERPELAAVYGIRSVPTMILFEDGYETKRITGAKPKAVLIKEFGL